MLIERKDATITATGEDTDFPGTFEVILSTPDLDRDGDIFPAEEWEQPLPAKITFDTDHGMSVASTVGSGVPTINTQKQLVVKGTFSSLPRAQETRTLVKEGHIDRTSVAYVTHRKQIKGGAPILSRELLNGAFVAVPANDAAKVLSSKGVKTGARNSATDAEHIQAIHDHAVALGATADDGTKAFRQVPGTKAVAGSFEDSQGRVSDALSALYQGDDVWAYPVATYADSVVFHVSGNADAGEWQSSYVVNDDGTATLGTPARVNLVEQIVPATQGDASATATGDVTAAKQAAVTKSVAAADAGSPVVTEEDVQAKALEVFSAQFM